MPKIVINSFRGGQANDKNSGQAGAFWNAKNINYRTNSSYIELAKGSSTLFSLPSSAIPSAITFWGTGGSITTDMVVFTSNGAYTSAGQQSVVADIVNVGEANGEKFFLTDNDIYQYTNPSTNTLLDTFTRSVNTRPTLDFGGDLIIGDGNQTARWTKTNVLEEYNGTTDCIGNLDGIITAITQINFDVYVWCNNGANTNLYIWDGVSPNWSRKVTYVDKAVQNVALLNGTHYWWQSKSHAGIREVIIGESVSPQVFVKSGFTEIPLSSNPDDEKNKMAIATIYDGVIGNSSHLNINAIETASDIVYLPGIGRIFTFGQYFPGDKYSFNAEHTFTGTYVFCMASGGYSGSGRDVSGMLAYCVLNGSSYDVNILNLGQDGETPSVTFATSGELETMEYIATNFAQGEDDVKCTIPFELPSTNCSIKVYEKRNRGSYVEIANLTYTNYPGYNVAEIKTQGKWRTKQFKFELFRDGTNNTSPKLYIGFTNETLEVGKTSSSR